MTAEAVANVEAPLRLQAGGTLNPRRHLYIERPDDATLLRLLSEGQYVNVLTSRQMGKSSLMVRTAQALTDQGARCAIVDLAAELGSPQDASAYFLGLLNKIARDLKIKADLPTWWAERSGETPNQRLIRFFREVVLEQVPGTVVCFLDEIDSTLKLPWTDDLFTALRGMYNERALVPAYERLTFCLLGVASPNELIKDRRTTPYNVGSTLELRDFDLRRDDLTPLSEALGANPEQGRSLVERVLHWTGGHPYLTARLCAALGEIGAQVPEDVDRRVDDTFRSLERLSGDVHFQQVLRFLQMRLADELATFGLYERVLRGARERDQTTPAHIELKLSGLVKRDEEGCLVVRNRIYERLFDQRWVESSKPRRALQRYRRWAVAASLALAFIGASAAIGFTYLRSQLSEHDRLAAAIAPILAGDQQRARGNLDAALQLYQDSLAILERLAAEDPSRAQGQQNLASGFERIGDVRSALGDLTAALAAYERSLAIREKLAARDPSNSDWQRDLSVSFNKIGDVQRARGDLEGALKAYEDGLAIREKLAAQNPSNSNWRRDLSVSFDRIGDVQRARGNLEAALKAYRDGLAIAEKLAAQDPSNSEWQRGLSVSFSKIGDVQSARGSLDAALKAYHDGLAIREKLAAQDPTNSGWQRDLSVSFERIGDVQRARGDLEAALKAYQDGLEIREKLAAQDPSNSEWQRDLSVSFSKIGDVQSARGNVDAALKTYEDGLAIAEKLAALDPSNAQWQRDLIVSNTKLAEVADQDGRATEAKRFYEAALEVAKALNESGRLPPADDWMVEELEKRLAAVAKPSTARP